MPSVTRSAGSGANSSWNGTRAWSSPANIVSSNNVDAGAANVSSSNYTQVLDAYDFGFNIPAGSRIDGIQARTELGATVAGNTVITLLQQGRGGTSTPSYKVLQSVAFNNTSDSVIVTGSSSNGSSLGAPYNTVDYVNSSNFCVGLQVTGGSSTNRTIYCDHISVTVTYTENVAPVFTTQPTLTPTNGRTRIGPSTPGNLTFRVTDNSTGTNALSYEIRSSGTVGGGTVYGSGTCTNNVTKTHTFQYSDFPDETTTNRALWVHVTDPDGGTTVSDYFVYNPDHAPPYAGWGIVTVTPDPTTTNQYTVSFYIQDVESTNPNELSYYVRSSQGLATNYLSGNATSGDELNLLVTDNGLVHGPNTRWLLLQDGAGNHTYYELTVNAHYVQTYDELGSSLTVRSVFGGVDEVVPDTEPPILLGSVTHTPDPVKKEG